MDQHEVLSQINILKCFLLFFFVCLFLKLLCCPLEAEDSDPGIKLKETTGSSWGCSGGSSHTNTPPLPPAVSLTATQSGKDVISGGGREWGRSNCFLRSHGK